MNYNSREINTILERPYTVKIRQYFKRGSEIIWPKIDEWVGFTLLRLVIYLFLVYVQPTRSIIVNLMPDVLATGYYFVAFRAFRGKKTEFADFFLGFTGGQLLPLLLVNLLIGFMLGVLSLSSLILMGLGSKPIYDLVLQPFFSGKLTEVSIPPILRLIALVVGLLLLIPYIYLAVSYMFAIPLVVDRQFDPWQAMETSRKLVHKQWLPWLGFSFLITLLGIAGVCACYIGILCTAPIGYCTLVAAYEDVIGSSQRNSPPE
jgi:hypothetical protein